MKSALATIIVLTAILALMAGSFAMINMGSGNHANCLAAIPGSPKCIGGMDPLQFAITHINALLSVSLGITSSLVLALVSALMLLAWLVVPDASGLLPTTSNYSRIFVDGNARSVRKQRHWISLLEKRDPSLSCAMNA